MVASPDASSLAHAHRDLVPHAVAAIAARLPTDVGSVDLTCAAALGLLHAARAYGGHANVPFGSYALAWIRRAIAEELRSGGWQQHAANSGVGVAAVHELCRGLAPAPAPDYDAVVLPRVAVGRTGTAAASTLAGYATQAVARSRRDAEKSSQAPPWPSDTPVTATPGG